MPIKTHTPAFICGESGGVNVGYTCSQHTLIIIYGLPPRIDERADMPVCFFRKNIQRSCTVKNVFMPLVHMVFPVFDLQSSPTGREVKRECF